MAEVISPEEALARIQKGMINTMSTTSGSSPKLIKTETFNNLPTVYTYTTEGNDYMILSADDNAEAMLAYGSDFSGDINPAMQWLLDEYSQEIASIRCNAFSATKTKNTQDRDAIAPMITTRWNQSSPYNNMCPEVNSRRCVTGCVATAMAQIINYHQPTATGTASYNWNGQTLSFDFTNETFDWDNMLDTYTSSSSETQQQAVAKLMYACGVSVSMNFGVYVSSTHRNNATKALINYWGFDKSLHLEQRIYYTAKEWNNYIYSQLQECGPVILRGANDSAGHMFVCDGYSSDGFFHINWGWGGSSDGYFKLSALNPNSQGIGGSTSGYNSGLEAIVNIKPANGESAEYKEISATKNLNVTTQSATFGDVITITGGFINQGSSKLSCSIGLIAEKVSTGKISTIASFNSILQPQTDYNQFNFTLPAIMGSGTYRIYPAWKTSESDWIKIRVPSCYPGYINMSVSNGNITFSAESGAQINMFDVHTVTPIILGYETEINALIENRSEYEYYGTVYAELLTADDDTAIASSATSSVEIEANTSKHFSCSTTFTRYDGDQLQPGDYILVFADQNANIISSGIQVKVINAPAENGTIRVSTLEYIGDSNNADKENLQFKATIECSDNDFFGEISLWIFSSTNYGFSTIGSLQSQMIYAENGETTTTIFRGAMPSLTIGQQYCCAVYRGSTYLSDLCYFTIGATSAIENLESDNQVIDREYYTITGVKVAKENITPGLYIVIEKMSNGNIISYKKIIY